MRAQTNDGALQAVAITVDVDVTSVKVGVAARRCRSAKEQSICVSTCSSPDNVHVD